MKSHRRGFFKTLLAGALAAVLPKPDPSPAALRDALALKQFFERRLAEAEALPKVAIAYQQNGHTFYKLLPEPRFNYAANFERANRHLAQLEAEWTDDMAFLSGDQWQRTLKIVNPDGSRKSVTINDPTSARSFPEPAPPSPLS